MSADINKVWWLHMHTFLPGRRVAFLGRPSQRLSLPTYWFIRGDLEPLCHMLPQMGTSPQAIQALWQQAWTIMDAKGKRQKELCQPPRQHKFSVRASICTCMDYSPLLLHRMSMHDLMQFLHLCGFMHLVTCCVYLAGSYRNHASREAPLYLTHVMVECVW